MNAEQLLASNARLTRKQIKTALAEIASAKKLLGVHREFARPSKADVREVRTYARQVKTGRVPRIRS